MSVDYHSERKTVPKALKNQLWDDVYGKNVGCVKCPICNTRDITQADFEAGHIVARARGGATTVSNLLPICKDCNRSMGAQHMYDYKKQFYSISSLSECYMCPWDTDERDINFICCDLYIHRRCLAMFYEKRGYRSVNISCPHCFKQ